MGTFFPGPGPGKLKIGYNIFMPGKNTHKTFVADHYYHVYNRGWNKGEIFLDDTDFHYFEFLLERHVSMAPVTDHRGRPYAHLRP